MKIKVIILDFDGVIVESVGIKDRAFRKLFEAHPAYLDRIMEYHLSHNAIVRFEKFRYITENIIGREYNKKIEKELSVKFSELVFNAIVGCPYVRGATDFLNYFYGRVSIYLASMSPADELDRIVEARNLKKYFKKIYAVPWVKADVIKDIMMKEEAENKEIIFIGDSLEDYQSAQKMNVSFIGRDSKKSFDGAAIPIYKDLFEIKKVLINNARKIT